MDIAVGDTVTLTSKVPESEVYPWVKAGTTGVIETVHTPHHYPYRVRFDGEFVVDPTGCPTIVKDPVLLFERDEIELEAVEPEASYFYSTSTPHQWSSGPRFHQYDPEAGGKIASLERAKELAEKARVGTWGEERLVRTTYGVTYDTEV